MKTFVIVLSPGLFCILALLSTSPVLAGLTITSAGAAEGLSLSTFATGFPSSNSIGPLGVAFPTSGGVLVSDQVGNVRRFLTDADNQIASAAVIGQNYGQANGLAQIGSNIYLAEFVAGNVIQINDDGTFKQTILSGVPDAVGLAADPANGHLFLSTRNNNQIFDIDPIAETKTLFQTVSNPDGISVSPDSSTLYVAETGTGHVLGYNIATKTLVFDSGAIAGGIDGTAAGAGQFLNDLFVNLNNGTVVEVDLTTKAQTVIASGGSRGDFAIVDPTNNTLLLTQTDQIIRLNGGNFVPEPNTLSLLGFGLFLFICHCRNAIEHSFTKLHHSCTKTSQK